MNLIVMGIEGGSYVAFKEEMVNGEPSTRAAIKNADGQPVHFAGMEEARDYFTRHRYQQAFLEHASAYDELIGNDASAQPARMGLHW